MSKYLKWDSATFWGGLIAILAGLMIWLSETYFPVLVPLVELIRSFPFVPVDASGESMMILGYFAITGRAAVPEASDQ